MRHAVGALLVAAGAVGIPVGGFHQFRERLDVAFAEQVARLLPAEDIARRHAPRRAVEFLVAGEEVEEQGGVRQVPLLTLAEREDLAEQVFGVAPGKEMLLIRRALIGIAGRDRHADAKLLGEIEEFGDVLGRMAVEDRAVDVDGEALGLGGLDRGDSLVEAAIHAHRLVVMVFDAVEMHRKEQIGRRFEQMQLLLKQQRIGAKRNEFLARHDPFDDRADLFVDEGLAAGNGDHRRAALVDRVETFLHRKALVQNRIGIIDLAATDAGQIAAEQRFQHEHERVAFAAGEPLLQYVGADGGCLS